MLGIGMLAGLAGKILKPGGIKGIISGAKNAIGMVKGIVGGFKKKGAGGTSKGTNEVGAMQSVGTLSTLVHSINTQDKVDKMGGGSDNTWEKSDKMGGGSSGGGFGGLGGGSMDSKTKDILTWGGLAVGGGLLIYLLTKK